MTSTEFPCQSVWVFGKCIPEHCLAEMRDAAVLYARAPNYWLPKDALENDLGCQMSTPAESAIWHLYHAVAKHRLPSDCTGAEWWVQVYENGRGLAFHFDKDEDSYKSGQDMKHPCLSSILYLTGSDEDRLRQACTVILDQRFDAERGVTDPESPANCVFVPPSVGKYCIFDGALGHGVLDASNTDRRMTLLVNWWKEKPAAIRRPSAGELEGLCGNEGRSVGHGAFLRQRDAFSRVADTSRVEPLTYPSIRIPSEDEDVKECGILVDDLLDAYLLDAFGENAVQAVSVRYEGHVLYPIDPSKTKQDISKKLIIPAAFVPENIEVGP